MREKYLTVKNFAIARLEINKSLFIAHAARAESDTDALKLLEDVRREHQDATHNCFACIAGVQDEYQKADDDGEPSGTAGKPMLEAIRKNGLRDTVLIVTRYFGGIKLGAGGLIRAYGKSASEGIKAAGIVERTLHSRLGVDIDYSLLGTVENQLRSQGYTITGKEFTHCIRLYVLEQAGMEQRLRDKVTEWTAGTAVFSDQGSDYVDTDL